MKRYNNGRGHHAGGTSYGGRCTKYFFRPHRLRFVTTFAMFTCRVDRYGQGDPRGGHVGERVGVVDRVGVASPHYTSVYHRQGFVGHACHLGGRKDHWGRYNKVCMFFLWVTRGVAMGGTIRGGFTLPSFCWGDREGTGTFSTPAGSIHYLFYSRRARWS